MAEPAPFKYPSLYSPGQIAFNDNAEMSRLISLFAGPMLQGMAGQGNFLPHMMPSQGLMDQYTARQYQNQTRASEFYMAGAGNQDVAKRLLAMRTTVTDDPASELNKAQAEQFAGFINNPMTKAIAGSLIGPENLEAMLHGRKGDVAGLNQVANRIGFFRNDPSGGKRMDANSLEDFSRGVYSHLYDEGGNLSGVERDVRAVGGDTATYNENTRVKSLKKFAKMEDRTVVSDDEVKERVTKRIKDKELSDEDVATTYKKYVAGDEKDTTKQAEALTKFDAAIKELDQTVKSKSADKSGLLGEKEVTVDKTVKQARENRLGEVNGFMAGQVGQMTEQMFQRGMLPQAIGAMSPDKRVELLSKERERDPETMKRLAEEFGHRDLMTRDAAYASATPEQQREMLQPKISGYQDKLNDVLTAADKFNAKDASGPKSVQEIEKMEGFDAVAGNVDAKRSAAAIKKYTGAVAAVREIFGDNGNPNAPMPALMAALDHLSQGASSQMDPKQIEASLRSMQQMAKESGVGFEQMAGMAAQMGAAGDMLGISKSQTMHNQVNAMAMVKTMRDTGAFSKPLFGAMSQAEATQFVGQKIQEGEASDNSRTMSALAGIYQADKAAFSPDSEFAQAMEAYNNPSSGGKYTIKGPDGQPIEKNIFEIVGKGGPQALQQMFKAAGGKEGQLSAAFMNPASQQFAQAGAGFQTQKYEMLRDVNNMAVSGTLNARLQEANKAAPGSELAKRDPSATADATGQAITELILESSGMKQGEQIDYIKKSMVPTLTEAFKKSGVKDENEARRLAEQAASAYMGADPAQQSGQVKQLIDQAGAFIYSESGMTTAQAYQTYGNNMPARSAKEAERNRAVAQRKAETGLNFSSHPMARMSDYLLEMGEKGGKVTAGGMFEALTAAIPEKELRDKYSQGMAPGVETVQTALNDLTVTDPYIQDLASTQDKNKVDKDAATLAKDTATLKQLAGVDDKTTIVTDAEFATRHNAKMADTLKDDKKVTEEFKRVFNEEKTTLSVEEQRTRLMSNAQFQGEQARETLAAGEMSQSQLNQTALQRSGGNLRPVEGETPEQTRARAQKRENLQTMRASFFEGADETKLNAGVSAALDYFDVDETQTNDKGQTISAELTQLVGSYDADPEKDKAHQKSLSDKVNALVSDSGFAIDDEQKAQMLGVLEAQRTGAKIDYGGVLGQIGQAAGAAQQVAQQIANASIDADKVTINAGRVDGTGKPDGTTPTAASTDAAVNAPVSDALPKPDSTAPAPATDGSSPPTTTATGASSAATGAAPTTAGGASGAASNATTAAQQTAAVAPTVSAAPPAAPGGTGGQQATTVTGTLRLENLEAGVLEVMAKRDAPPTQTEGGGASIHTAKK
jgi:hypothetical protein